MDWKKVYYKKIKYIASNAKKWVHLTSFSICIDRWNYDIWFIGYVYNV